MATVKAKNKDGKLTIKVKAGALHSALGVDQNKKLTAKQEQVEPGDSALMKKRKVFAQNARSWGK